MGEELQAGITEIAEVPPPKKAGPPPWLYDSCVAFMGRDQWFKARAGSRSKPSSWAGILIKLGLLGLTYKELSTRLCLPGPTQLVRLLNATVDTPSSGRPCLPPWWPVEGQDRMLSLVAGPEL